MDTFAALALATDPADPESLDRKPDRKTAPLISVQMWMMVSFNSTPEQTKPFTITNELLHRLLFKLFTRLLSRLYVII